MNKKIKTVISAIISAIILIAIILTTTYFILYYPPMKAGGKHIGFVDGTYAAYNIEGLEGQDDLDSFSFTLERLEEYDSSADEMIGSIKVSLDIVKGGQKIAVTPHGGGTAKAKLGNGKYGSCWFIEYLIEGEIDTYYSISGYVIGEDKDSVTGFEANVAKEVFYGEPDEHNIRPSVVTTIYKFTMDKIA